MSEPIAKKRTLYQTLRRTLIVGAIVAALFCTVVATIMVQNRMRLTDADVLESGALVRMKQTLSREPDNTALQDEIRRYDRRLREEYFQRRMISRRGSWLLAAGGAVLAICLALLIWTSVPKIELRGVTEDPDATLRRRYIVQGALISFTFAVIAGGWFLLREVGLPKVDALQARDQAAAPVDDFPSREQWLQNWPRFRGPRGDGAVHQTDVPLEWDGSTGQNILWKSPLGLPGKNSPVIWENRVFISGADKSQREVYCYSADTGERLWSRKLAVAGRDVGVPEVLQDTGFAAPTCTVDGRYVVAMFANGDIGAFTVEGEQVWSRNLELPENVYGHASSLTMFRGNVIVLFDQGTADDGLSALLALRASDGEIVWRTQREVPNSWATPLIFESDERFQIVTAANPFAISYDPKDGSEIWRANVLGGDIGPSPIYADEYVITANEGAAVSAIRPDGSGDVTDTHVAWEGYDGVPNICSPIADDQRLWLLTGYGQLTCYRLSDGEMLYTKMLDAGFIASPSLIGNKLLLFTEKGESLVIPAADEFSVESRSPLGENVDASPAFAKDRIYIRGQEHLFCIGRKQK